MTIECQVDKNETFRYLRRCVFNQGSKAARQNCAVCEGAVTERTTQMLSTLQGGKFDFSSSVFRATYSVQ